MVNDIHKVGALRLHIAMEGGGFQQQITNMMGEAHLLGAALRGTESKTCIRIVTNYTLCAEHVVSGIHTQTENVMDLLHCNKLQYSNPCYPIDQHSI